MRKKKKSLKDELTDGLRQLALGDSKDAVKLLFLDDENAVNELPKLDLVNISEIKKPKGGGMEIKFFDRIKAMDKLFDMENVSKDEPLSFYNALNEGAKNSSDILNGDDNE